MMHNWHPLHLSVSTSMAPFNFAITYLFDALKSKIQDAKVLIYGEKAKENCDFSNATGII